MLEMVKLADPEFDTVSVCAALVEPKLMLPKASEAGESVTVGAGAAPVPISATVCGLPARFVAMDMEPVRVPVTVGVNVTATEQLCPAARDAPQVVVSAKSPDAVIPDMLTAPDCAISVIDCAGLVVPVVWLAKVNDAGETPRLTPAATERSHNP